MRVWAGTFLTLHLLMHEVSFCLAFTLNFGKTLNTYRPKNLRNSFNYLPVVQLKIAG